MNEAIKDFARCPRTRAIYPNITGLYEQRLEAAVLALEALKMAEETLKLLMEKK